MSGEERKGLESFLSFGGKLKKLKRAGWLRYVHPSDVESVADHSFGVAFHFLGLPDSDLVVNGQLADRNKCAAMALAHDLAESVVGDITPLDGISEKEKREKEKNAFLFICKFLDDKRAKEVRELWEEYERGETPEAMLVKDADKFDMITKAFEYENSHGVCLEEFFSSTENAFRTEVFKELNRSLRQQRSSCCSISSSSCCCVQKQ